MKLNDTFLSKNQNDNFPNIVFLDAGTLFDVSNLNLLSTLGYLQLYHHTQPNQVVERLKNAHIVITNKVILDKNILEKCHFLKLICVAATGTNNIDVNYANQKAIEVKNAKGYASNSVAQVTFTMILTLLQSPFYYDNYVKNGNYAQNEFFTHVAKPFSELSGKNLGIIGLGDIGKKIAAIATAFGMQVHYTSVSGVTRIENYPHLTLDDLLSISDVVSINTPLTEKSKNLITLSHFKKMKNTAILINVARGGIVNEHDLATALNQNMIAAAGTDVFDSEPIRTDNPLFSVKDKNKLLMFPHLAWASVEAREKLVEIVYNNIFAFLSKKS